MHTPGPWSFEDKPSVVGGTFKYWVIGPEGERIADIQQQCRKTEANATLIATAPELLEALEKIADIEREKMDGRIKEYNSYDMEWAIAIARQAVNKVKGG